MSQRIAFPSDVCPDPGARYYRTLAQAFPCSAAEAVALHQCKRRPRYGLWLTLALAAIVLAALAGCTAQAAEEQPLAKQELSAARACPKGYAVEWASPTEMQCLKEQP